MTTTQGRRRGDERGRPAAGPARTPRPHAEVRTFTRTPFVLWSTVGLALAVLGSSAYGLLAETPYRSLPDSTVLGAKAQDVCSVVAAVALVVLVSRPVLGTSAELTRLGLLGYLAYSYLIYVTGVPMNRVFLLYVIVVALSVAGLVTGLVRVLSPPPDSTATARLRRGTGWMLLVTAVLFAGLWLSTLLPFALGGDPPATEGVGGLPYPVFWLDLTLVLPAIATVGVLLLRGRAAGPPLAVVALVKIVTLFVALWAGPLVALFTEETVDLGPDAGPSALLLVVSTALVVAWLRTFPAPSTRSVPPTAPSPRRLT